MIGLVIVLLILLIGFLVYVYRKDRRFLHGRTRDSLSPAVRQEIDAEIADGRRRQQHFRQSLENAAKLSKLQDNSLTSKG